MRDVKLKWLYLLAIFLLLFLSIYVFMKLSPIWIPLFSVLRTFLLPFIIAIFITYLLHPIVEKLHHQKLPRPLAILLIYFLFFGGLGFALYKGVPVIIQQLKDLAESSPQFLNTYRTWLYEIEEGTSQLPTVVHEKVDDFFVSMEAYLGSILSRTLESIKGIVNSILLFAIIPFIVFYMLKDYDEMIKALWYITPRKWRKSGQLFLRDVDESLGNYIRGQLAVCVIVGCITSIAFWLTHMQYPLLLGSIVGMTNIIPYFGPILGAIPAAIIAATISSKMLILVIVIIFVVQFLEGNVLSPLIVGKSLHMHPLVIMAALLLGGEVGGIIGLVTAVPIVAILKVFLVHAKLHFIKR